MLLETDGAVKALTGGPDYGESQFNRATHAKRQPGSSFKVYVYATALENGYTPTTMVRDAARPCGGRYASNYGGGGGGGGRLPLCEALEKSLNTVAVDLSFAVGRDKVIEMTQRLGITGIRKTCTMAIGDYGITPLEHAGGFATFANGGKLAKPYAILDLVSSKGDLVYSRDRDEPEAPAGRQAQGRRGHELDDEQGGRPTAPARARQARLHQRRRQDRDHRRGRRTSGSSASPASTWERCGSATTTTVPWRRARPAAISQPRSGIPSCRSCIPT